MWFRWRRRRSRADTGSREQRFFHFLLDTLLLLIQHGGMTCRHCGNESDGIELRQQANYWRAQHARAVEREAFWKEKALQLEAVVRRQEQLIEEQAGQIEALKAQVALLQRQVFGRKSEKKKSSHAREDKEDVEGSSRAHDALPEERRKRGQQPGAKGHGRKRRENLPTEEVLHDLPQSEQCCSICGKAFLELPGTEDAEEVDWEVRVLRRIHRRKRYLPDCDCQAHPGIVTAPAPPKLIPKGMFSVGFWVHLLLEKFLFQRPLHRIRQVLALEGLSVSSGTLTGGLKRIGELLQPLYAALLEKSREADHWHMDETRWMVFVELAGKIGHKWWLWVIVTRQTCAYILDPSRSSKVPKDHLGKDAKGILSVDRYSAYKSYEGIAAGVRIAFCWTHVKRDFDRIEKGYKKLRPWAEAWLRRIGKLYRLNDKRLEVKSKLKAFDQANQALREFHAAMAEERDRELADAAIHDAQRKALTSMRNHWEGLSIFLDNPDVPMDNNEAERRLRNPVIGDSLYPPFSSARDSKGLLVEIFPTWAPLAA